MSRTDIREVVQEALGHYGAGRDVAIVASDGTLLHAPPDKPLEGIHQVMRIMDVDREAFEKENVSAILDEAQRACLKRRAANP